MSMIGDFKGVWPRDCLVVDVETLHLLGEAVPLTFGLASAVNHKFAATCHRRINWNSHRSADGLRPSDRCSGVAGRGKCLWGS